MDTEALIMKLQFMVSPSDVVHTCSQRMKEALRLYDRLPKLKPRKRRKSYAQA